MNKYRVLKPYPKQITNSGRLVTLSKGKKVYLKKEPQVLRLVKLGFLKPIVEIPKKAKKPAKRKEHKPKPAEVKKEVKSEEPKSEQEQEESKSSRRRNKSEYLNRKNKGKSKDSQSN